MEPNRPPRSSTTSTLGWIGCGCGALVALALVSILGMTWFGYHKGKEIERTFRDPVARTEATRKILKWRELPEGYYPAGAVSIPMLMEMAILSDEEQQPEDAGKGRAFGKRGLIFMSFNSWISDEKELLSWLKGETKETPDWIRRSDATIDPDQVLKRGTVEVNGRTIVYVVSRGDDVMSSPPKSSEAPEPSADSEERVEEEIPGEVEEIPVEEIPEEAPPAERETPETAEAVETEEAEPEATDAGTAEAEAEPEEERSARDEGLMTFFSLDCPGDNRARLGVWFAPDPSPGTPNAEVDLQGTIGDPEVIREFVGHFEPCG